VEARADPAHGWQAGLLWRDRSRKPSYDAFKSAIAEIRRWDTDGSKVSRLDGRLSSGAKAGQP
jgi:hypothetical protein